jgi:hypothetical protein
MPDATNEALELKGSIQGLKPDRERDQGCR